MLSAPYYKISISRPFYAGTNREGVNAKERKDIVEWIRQEVIEKIDIDMLFALSSMYVHFYISAVDRGYANTTVVTLENSTARNSVG